MKKILAILCALTVVFFAVSCGSGEGQNGADANEQTRQTSSSKTDRTGGDTTGLTAPQPEHSTGSETQPQPPVTKEDHDMSKIQITVGSKTFTATLYDNASARALADLFPVTLDMSELNGNEKYNYLDQTLPTNASKPSGIQTGDLMLYGNNCLVLFYKSFSTSYSYTPLGRIDDPEGLAAALGSGGVTVVFTAL